MSHRTSPITGARRDTDAGAHRSRRESAYRGSTSRAPTRPPTRAIGMRRNELFRYPRFGAVVLCHPLIPHPRRLTLSDKSRALSTIGARRSLHAAFRKIGSNNRVAPRLRCQRQPSRRTGCELAKLIQRMRRATGCEYKGRRMFVVDAISGVASGVAPTKVRRRHAAFPETAFTVAMMRFRAGSPDPARMLGFTAGVSVQFGFPKPETHEMAI